MTVDYLHRGDVLEVVYRELRAVGAEQTKARARPLDDEGERRYAMLEGRRLALERVKSLLETLPRHSFTTGGHS